MIEVFKIDSSHLELLQYAIDHDMLDLSVVQTAIDMEQRKKYLNDHHYWQGKNGKWYTYLPDEKKGRVQKTRNTKEEIEKLIISCFQDDVYLDGVFYEWISYKQKYKEISQTTVDKYNSVFVRFFKKNINAKKIRTKKFKNILEDDLEEFIKMTISDMELTRKAYNDMKTIINGIFRYGKKKKYTTISISYFMDDLLISKNSFKKVLKDKEKEVFNEKEVEFLTGNLRTRDKDIRALGNLLLFETGMRIGELSGLKKEDVNTKAIHVRRTEVKEKDENGKFITYVKDFPKSNSGNRYIVLTEKACETINMILKLNPDGEYLFMENGKRICSHAFRRKLMRICKELDIEYRSNHKIRKTYGTMLIDNNVDESIVAEQMGHADITTTKKYYYFSNKGEENKREQILYAIGCI